MVHKQLRFYYVQQAMSHLCGKSLSTLEAAESLEDEDILELERITAKFANLLPEKHHELATKMLREMNLA